MNTREASNILMGSLLFFMMVFPVTAIPIKLFLMLVVAILNLKRIARDWSAPKQIFIAFNISFIIIIIYTLYGAYNDNPGAIRTLTVTLVYPMMMLLLAGLFEHKDVIPTFHSACKASLIAILMISYLYFMNRLGYVGFDISALLNSIGLYVGGGYGYYDGFYEYSLLSISSLLFLAPYQIIFSIISRHRNRASSYIDILITISTVFLIVVTGRRALLVLAVISIIIAFVLSLLVGISWRKRLNQLKNVVFMSLAIYVCYFFIQKYNLIGLNFDAVWQTVVATTQAGQDASANTRIVQYEALIKEFSLRPLIGYGTGYALPDVIRSDTQPWAYEIMYVAFLVWFGVIAFGIFLLMNIFSYLMSITTSIKLGLRNDVIYSSLVASFIFLLGNSTNPYLFKFDYIWILFLPVFIWSMNYREIRQMGRRTI